MKTVLKRLLAPVACALFLTILTAAAPASHATPVTSTFSGTVTGYEFGFLDPNAVAYDNDHPIGTAVQWSLTFDDSFLGLPWWDVFATAPLAVSGSLQVGADHYTFTEMSFFSMTFDSNTNAVIGYRPQVSAVGPSTSDGGDFFGMFWSFDTSLGMTHPAMIGFGYSNDWSTTYGYLTTAGTYSVGPAGQVPEPATALLLLPAVMLLRRRRR